MAIQRTILIVDDERGVRDSLQGVLSDEGYSVSTVSSGKAAIELVRKEHPDLILLDIWMPEMDGLDTLRVIREENPYQTVIMMSGHGNIETAVKATKLGAYDFIEKPLSLEKILVLIQNALKSNDLQVKNSDLVKENQELRKHVQRNKSIVGESQKLKDIQELIQRVAPTTGSVLITGENGTGKELVAQSIHSFSPRFSKPFIEVNCAAIPEDLIESELFGHEKGAFTGAVGLKRGKFDLANGGTLFLDEIADMSLKTQAKILRIIQEQKFERVGGSQTITVDVRIVAATNKDLKAEIAAGRFREDLFYRLNVVPIQLPALRERQRDAILLAEHFLADYAQTYLKKPRGFTPDALGVLEAYSWPGNVRELKNLIERIMILTAPNEEGMPITPAVLLKHINDDELESRYTEKAARDQDMAHLNLKDAKQEFEKDFIVKKLKENDWNVSKTSNVLGIERSHLHRKMKSYGIESDE